MPTTTRLTSEQLTELGYTFNPNCWIGSGFLFCGLCRNYYMHYTVSKGHDHKLVCGKCRTAETK